MKKIPEHPNYLISEEGAIYSLKTNKFLKPQKLNHGHLVVSLGRGKKYLVHRLVLETFIGPCPKGMETCHNNDVPNDNRLENLRWDTHSNNHKDKVKNGNWVNPTKPGEKNPRAKLTNEQASKIYSLYHTKGFAQRKLAKMFNVGKTTVAHLVNGDTWKSIKLHERKIK